MASCAKLVHVHAVAQSAVFGDDKLPRLPRLEQSYAHSSVQVPSPPIVNFAVFSTPVPLKVASVRAFGAGGEGAEDGGAADPVVEAAGPEDGLGLPRPPLATAMTNNRIMPARDAQEDLVRPAPPATRLLRWVRSTVWLLLWRVGSTTGAVAGRVHHRVAGSHLAVVAGSHLVAAAARKGSGREADSSAPLGLIASHACFRMVEAV